MGKEARIWFWVFIAFGLPLFLYSVIVLNDAMKSLAGIIILMGAVFVKVDSNLNNPKNHIGNRLHLK